MWANLGQEMLYDGDISGDDEYTLETLQAAAVEIIHGLGMRCGLGNNLFQKIIQ